MFLSVVLPLYSPSVVAGETWLGTLNRWLFDSNWEEELVGDTYMLSKTSLTDDSLLLAITCGLKKPTLAVMIFSDPSKGPLPDKIKLSFDEGPYFEEQWTIRNKPNAVVQGGDMAFILLRRLLTSDVLRVHIRGRGFAQDRFKFYLDGLRKFSPRLKEYCNWPD